MKWWQSIWTLPVFFYYLFSGVCLGIGVVVPWLWWLVIFGITIFLWVINRTSSWLGAFLGGWLAFTIKLLFAHSYFLTTYPIEWIDLSLGKAEFLVVTFYWLTVALAIGLSGGLLAVILNVTAKRLFPSLFITTAIIFWVPAEILGALFFSIFTYGPGGTINTLYTFGYSGYLLAQQPLIFKLASFGGVFTLSFCSALLGAGLYYCLINYRRRPILLRLTFIFATVLFVTVFLPTSDNQVESDTKIAIVDTRFGGEAYFALPAQEREKLRVAQMIEATKEAVATGADYVVMPEESRYLPNYFSPEKAYAFFRFEQTDTEAIVVDAGQAQISQNKVTLRSHIYDGKTKKVYATDKQYLVPQGEFMPNFSLGFFRLIGLADSIEEINQKLAYRPGPLVKQNGFPKDIPGILFCFSEADPLAVRRLVQEHDLPFVAHPISHAWFHSPYSLWFQLDTMLRIQARWNKTDIVSAGNMVKGALYNKSGQKIKPQEVSSGEYWTVSLVTR